MSTRTKRRMIAVSGIIIVVLIVVLAVVGGNTAARTVTVAEAAQGNFTGQKVQVTGNVVPQSYTTEGNTLTFSIYDPENPATTMEIVYNGVASSTFGNDVTAICTGRIENGNVLQCTELVTKCPSKYESGIDALSIEQLLGYGESMNGVMVKISGVVKDGMLNPAGSEYRFVLEDPSNAAQLFINYDGALADSITNGTAVILTGSLNQDGSFTATDVALEG